MCNSIPCLSRLDPILNETISVDANQNIDLTSAVKAIADDRRYTHRGAVILAIVAIVAGVAIPILAAAIAVGVLLGSVSGWALYESATAHGPLLDALHKCDRQWKENEAFRQHMQENGRTIFTIRDIVQLTNNFDK